MDFKSELQKYKSELDGRLALFFKERVVEVENVDGELKQLLLNLREVSQGGKRVRGFLFMVGYALSQGWDELRWNEFPEKIWNGGLALELFHLGLLVQDDVMDEDEERRGVKAIQIRYQDLHYGEAVANLGADMCFGWAIKLLAESGAELIKVWGDYFVKVGWGQVLDLQTDLDLEKYRQMIVWKTAEYTGEMPLVLGWLAGGQKQEAMKWLFEWGKKWGMLFQLVDDLDDGDGLVELKGEEKVKQEIELFSQDLLKSGERFEAELGANWSQFFRSMVGILIT